jgi:hypothetical protein
MYKISTYLPISSASSFIGKPKASLHKDLSSDLS